MDDPGGKPSKEAQAIDTAVDIELDDPPSEWWGLCRSVTEQTPTQMDYIYEEWSHKRIAIEFLETVKQSYNMQPDE